jgi:hypothetical protein
MKKIILSVLIMLLIGGFYSNMNAQNDILNIFKSGLSDLNKVANGYLTPAGNCFSAGLGSDWYNTAAVHKPFGFDLTIGADIIQAPLSDQTFSLSGLTNLKTTDASMTSAPSFTGKGNGVELNLMQPQFLSNGQSNPLYGRKIVSFNTPSGVSKYVPSASIQFTLGLPYINDVSIRLVPTITADGFKASLWGIGIKHNFKQWIPALKVLPFDAAVALSYTKFDLKYSFSPDHLITPDQLVSNDLTYAADPSSNDYSNQAMKISATAKSASIIFSKKLAFITPYVGFGITNTSFDLSMVGNYPTLGDPVTTTEGGVTVAKKDDNGKYIMQIKNVTDPINISSSEVMTNATVGLRMKVLWIFSVHAQYAFQKYPVASVGFGISIR